MPFKVSVSLGADTIKNPTFTRVTIRHTHQVASGIQGTPTIGMTIADCFIRMNDGHGILIGNDTHIINTTSITRKVSGGPGSDDNAGVVGNGKSGLRIERSFLEGRLAGVQLKNNCTDVRIIDSVLNGSHYGFQSKCGDDIEVIRCTISGDSARGNEGGIPPTPYHGVFIEDKTGCEPGALRFVNCDISARSNKRNQSAFGVYVENAPASTDGPVTFENCTITAFQEAPTGETDTAQSFGVRADEADSIALIGGSISSSDGDEREPDQYDIRCPTPLLPDGEIAISTSGTEFSKWFGPVGAAVAPVPVVQRTIGVPAAASAVVYGPTTLPATEQEVTTLLTNPSGYRVLNVTLSQAHAASYTLVVIGTNAAGERIADAIIVSQGQTSAAGVKPFNTVTKLIVQAGSGTVSVGTTDTLGLKFPIESIAAVQQQGRMAAASTGYTIGSPGTVVASRSTVAVAPITTGDSLEWAARASE